MNQKPENLSEVGQNLCRIVRERPGIHFRGLGREASLTSAGQLRHHLDRLVRHGVLIELEDGRYKRFFLAGDHDPQLRPGIARFARTVPRQIGKLLLMHPMNRTELRRSLGCADSTLGYHLTRMIRHGDVEKNRGTNCCRYALTNHDLVRRVLLSAEAVGPMQTTVQARDASATTAPGLPTSYQPGLAPSSFLTAPAAAAPSVPVYAGQDPRSAYAASQRGGPGSILPNLVAAQSNPYAAANYARLGMSRPVGLRQSPQASPQTAPQAAAPTHGPGQRLSTPAYLTASAACGVGDAAEASGT